MVANTSNQALRVAVRVLIYTLITVFCLGLFTASQTKAEASTPTVKSGEKYGAEVGTLVDIPVFVTDAPGMAGFQFDLRFDPEIAVLKPRAGQSSAVKLGSFLSGSDPIVNYNNAADGLVRIAWMDLKEVTGSGEICIITFEVISKGTTELELERVELVRLAGRFSVESSNGFITDEKQADVVVSGVSISGGARDLVKGNTVQLSATVEPVNAYNKDVKWSSGKTAVATVNSDGLVTAIAEGSTEITVTTVQGGFKDKITVTVRPSGIIISTPRQLPHAYRGRDYEFVLTARGENTSFTWSIHDGSLPPGLSLDSSGEITGIPTGTGRYDFTLRVTDEDDNETDQDFTLWIAEKDATGSSGSLYPPDWGNFKSLTINHGSMEVNLQPHEMPFTMVVDRNTTQVNVQVDLYRSTDKLTANGSTLAPATLRSFNLNPGTNTINIYLQPSTGNIRQYNITIFKLP